MGALQAIGRGVDDLVGVFSPRLALARRTARAALEGKRYAAAKTNRLTGSWIPANQNVNDLIASASPALRSRMRQLVRDFPYFAHAVRVITDYTVGTGITLQAKVKADGKLNKAVNQQIEDAWRRWVDEADATGRLDFYEMQRLAKRQECETGEFLIIKVQLRDPRRYLPLALQMVEPDWLTEVGAKPTGKNAIHQGIEYDPKTGRPVAYWIEDPDSWGKPMRVKAEDVIHGFDLQRPGQLRGVTLFAPAILLAKDLGDYIDAEIDGAKLAAKWLAFVQTPDPMSQLGRLTGPESLAAMGENADAKIEELANGIIEYLQPGEKIELASHQRPGVTFDPTTKLILRMVAVTTGFSYEAISGDYSGVNYSSLRGIRNDDAAKARPHQRRAIRQLCDPVYRAFMDQVALRRLRLPGYFADPTPWLQRTWQPPTPEPVDPFKQAKTHADQLKTGIRSYREVIATMGRDVEDVFQELADDLALAEKLGLPLGQANTPLASNPAALGANES